MVIDMKIERIDDKTVKCFLSNEELEEYNIDYKDFVMRSDKAREIVQEIMVHAEEEVGYKPPKFAFDLQIMMLPDQGLVLTFSEKDSEIRDGDQLIEFLKEMKRLLQQTRERVNMIGAAEGEAQKGAADNSSVKAEENNSGKTKKDAGGQQENRPSVAVFAFSSIGKAMEYAAVLPANLRVDSAFYQMNDLYYLYLGKGHAAYDRYSRACIQALEFGGLYTADDRQILWLQEHAQCLIAEKALKKLRG